MTTGKYVAKKEFIGFASDGCCSHSCIVPENIQFLESCFPNFSWEVVSYDTGGMFEASYTDSAKGLVSLGDTTCKLYIYPTGSQLTAHLYVPNVKVSVPYEDKLADLEPLCAKLREKVIENVDNQIHKLHESLKFADKLVNS